MALTVPGFVVVIFVLWYSMGVWKSTDRYFRDEYKNHLKKEIEKNKYLKEEEINKLISERQESDKPVTQGELDKLVENFQFEDKSVTKNSLHESLESNGIADEDSKGGKSSKTSEDWEDDNFPHSRDSVCYADRDELCKLTIAQQATEDTLHFDYTDEEVCSMQSGSADYCQP
ncbi:uncharacterized protein LOC111062392 isoform X2 [Nilaparvata lugens]|uniref:uncharacterized protein LOC111062392 isoform X1 n=1 Tax=Nilaparvata lugens TaxID=108931 RepID=UPI00193D842A|nr:uncharacterized protein LOC111062392 isoform X1 [Nilaparvata lugens]XP_039290931.1 uncharacterized protein LOC111062392 isoform X2 [Nilaparvata lugens]